MKRNVLFVCIHNSARSQMAEAWLRHICPDEFEAHSAGLEPGALNPLVVKVMREAGVDISHHQAKSVVEIIRSGRKFSHVITVCDESSAERCPIFPGITTRLHWSFPDPSALGGTREQRLDGTRRIRDEIRERVEAWCGEMCGAASMAAPANR
jgi:arsenate reductase